MTASKLGISVLLLAMVAVSGIWALAGDDDDAPEQDHVTATRTNDDDRPNNDGQRDGDRRRDRRTDRDRRGDEDPDDEPNDAIHVQHLGRTVKLEFKILGPEEEPSFIVLVAATDYLISHDIAETNHEHALEIIGQVHPTDDPDRIFLTFEAMTHHADFNEDFDATHRAEGSASLRIGKKTTLANLGADQLTVIATMEE